MSEVRIFQPSKTAMQSGRNNTKKWVLEFEPSTRMLADPLIGWIGSSDTSQQIRIHFNSKEDAISYADKNGLCYDLQDSQRRRIQPKNYSDNFSSLFRFK